MSSLKGSADPNGKSVVAFGTGNASRADLQDKAVARIANENQLFMAIFILLVVFIVGFLGGRFWERNKGFDPCPDPYHTLVKKPVKVPVMKF